MPIVDWVGLGKRLLGPQQVASARITRSPIYRSSDVPEGAGAAYEDNKIMFPQQGELNPQYIRHEEAHNIWDRAGLYNMGRQLAGQMDPQRSAWLTGQQIYKGYPPQNLASEGFAYGVAGGSPQEQPYVNAVQSQIQDPQLQMQLKRLRGLK